MVQKPRWMLCFRDLYFLHTLIFTETMTKQSLSRSSGTAQAAVLADKADLGMCIKSAYDRSDRAALKDISQNVIPGIICNLTDMKSSREKIWMNDAKPFGYEILDIKIGGVITRLKSTGYRIDNYLNGNVLRLEELEEERLPYFTKGMDKRENLWNRIISGCDLNDTI